MKKRLFIFTTLIVVTGLLVFFGATLYITATNNLKMAKDTVMETTHICADLYGDITQNNLNMAKEMVMETANVFADMYNGITDISSLPRFNRDELSSVFYGFVRLTVIDSNGAVIADSGITDISTMENHLDRPEVQAALNDSPETFLRYSETLDTYFIYYVLKVESNNDYVFVRTALPVNVHANLFVDIADNQSFVKAGGDTRITVIASDGEVIADSSPINMTTVENHLSRPEVQAALNGSPKTSVRYSNTVGKNLIYYAIKVDVGDDYVFVRTSVSVEKLDNYLLQSLPLLILALAVVILLCFYLIRNMTKGILKPFTSVQGKLRKLAEGSYEQSNVSAYNTNYDEVNVILREIDDVALLLQNSITDLHDEKSKLDYIISNIGDGLFAIDDDKKITLINNSALDMFSVKHDIIGKSLNYLTADKSISNAVSDSVKHGKTSIFEVTLFGKIYVVTVKNLPDSPLTMVILSDVTENRESAKRREAFFANASHELKTPLTAIKMFNELTATNSKEENCRKYIDGITRETDRMLSLIGDMLKLSELAELDNTKNINPVDVPLAKVVEEVRETLSGVIGEKLLNFEIIGEAVIKAEHSHVYDVAKNIIENAVRYSNSGGKVSIMIKQGGNGVNLFVSDEGIGIPPEEQIRIFERFYRVDKGRSQVSGGTGLGLSIVKHICALYDWKLSLKSKVGAGTEVSLEFKRFKEI